MTPEISYTIGLEGVDWAALVAALEADNFHNGRTVAQMEDSCRNSALCVFAWLGNACVGTVRVLSDGVCNAYVVDVWTRSDLRRRGIGRRMMTLALDRLAGQHIYLFTHDQVEFYRALGFSPQPHGMGRIAGTWLQNDTTPPPASA